MAEVSIIFTISAILFLSPFFSRYLKVATPPVEILFGMIAAYFGFISDHHLFELIAHVGFFYLMFMAGTEVNLRIFVDTDKSTLKKGILYLIILYVISTLSVLYLDLNKIIIIIIPTLSVGLILALYKDYGKDASWLNLSMLVGTIGELVSISLLTFTGVALESGIGMELYKSAAYLVLLLGSIVIIFKLLHVLFWWHPEYKVYLMPHLDKEEQDLRLSMALFSLMVGLMLWLHLEIAFGAFIAGIFIATFFEHKENLPHKLSSFGFGFLVPIFFIYIGSTFKIMTLLEEGVVVSALEIVGLMIFARVVSSFVFIKTLGVFGILKFALSQSMPLTLITAIATIAYNSQFISLQLYSALIFAALVEVIIAMVSIKMLVFISDNRKVRAQNES